MNKANVITREDILDGYTNYVMLLKDVWFHKFEFASIYCECEPCEHKDVECNDLSLKLGNQSIDEDIINKLILVKENYASLKKTFDEMLKESESKDDKLEVECIKWLSNNIFLNGYILTDICKKSPSFRWV